MEYEYGIVPLTQGAFAIVDPDDIVDISQYKWHITTKGYAARRRRVSEGGGIELLHRRILGIEGSAQGDHINRDKLDNRRANLRTATGSQNQANRGLDKSNTTGYRGVTNPRRVPGYVAQINVGGKSIFLGYFRDKHDAAEAYNLAAREHFGEYAYQNVIDREA